MFMEIAVSEIRIRLNLSCFGEIAKMKKTEKIDNIIYITMGIVMENEIYRKRGDRMFLSKLWSE